MLPKNLTSTLKTYQAWDSLVVQCLQLHAPNAGNLDLIPSHGTRSLMPQQKLKIQCAATKAWHNQINKH